jgi:APA family basic amino acid/polyamine antiporter
MEPNVDRIESLQSESTQLNRVVGLFGGMSVLMGIMIGSGIFYIGSYVLIRCNMNLGLSLVVWIIGGLVTMISGLCYAELGAMMPKAGGQYVYLREAFSERLAFMSGFSAFILGNTGSVAALAVAFSMGISNFIGVSELGIKMIAIFSVVLLTYINIRGIKFGAIVQSVSLIAKVIPIVLIIALGLILGNQDIDLSLSTVYTEGVVPSDLFSMMGYAIVATLWAYEGWTNLNVISEEIKNPKRNIPLAIVFSIILVTVIYTVFHLAIYKVLSAAQISEIIENGNYYIGTEVAKELLGNTGEWLVGIGMIVAIFGALNGCVMAFPRMYYAMAQDGLFFKSFKEVDVRYQTPKNALLGSMVIAIILICFRNLDQLTLLVIFSGMMFNTLTFISVLRLRKKYPDMNRPYKVWGGKVTIIIVTCIMIALAINAFLEDPINSALGLIIPVIGFAIYQLKFNNKRVR